MKLGSTPTQKYQPSTVLERINWDQKLLNKLYQKWYESIQISYKREWDQKKSGSRFFKLTLNIIEQDWVYSTELNNHSWVRWHSHEFDSNRLALEYSNYSSATQRKVTRDDQDRLLSDIEISVDEYFGEENTDIFLLEWHLKALARSPKFMRKGVEIQSSLLKTLWDTNRSLWQKIKE